MATRTYDVTGMSCGHCESAVREELERIDGLHVDAVSAAEGTLVVASAGDIDDAAVIAAVDEAGYAAVPAVS